MEQPQNTYELMTSRWLDDDDDGDSDEDDDTLDDGDGDDDTINLLSILLSIYWSSLLPCREPTAILFVGGLELSMLPTTRQPTLYGRSYNETISWYW